jgi:hypothetical protein
MTTEKMIDRQRRAMGQGRWRTGVLAIVGALLFVTPPVLGDVTPGDKIDQSNWQKIEGLVPDPLLNYVKKGDFVLNIGKLNYEPVWGAQFQNASAANAGKYDIDEEGGIIDPEIGKRPEYIYGFPFPDIDPQDPKAAVKIMWNRNFTLAQWAQQYIRYNMMWVGRGGFEREVSGESMEYFNDGRPNKAPNPDGTEVKEWTHVESPASVDGFLQLTWRYMDNRPDSCWSYVPAARRTRQLSSANRSDPFLGSDFTSDDTYMWFGKNQSMTWKLVGQQDVLVQTVGPDPIPIEPGPQVDNGGLSWLTKKDFKGAQMGYETPGWKGAPWAPTNMIWVKRPAWVIEAFPKDPYYSYGRQVYYADRENGLLLYKVVYNRAGEYWKLVYTDFEMGWSPDGAVRYPSDTFNEAIDDKSNHSAIGNAVGFRGQVYEYNSSRPHPAHFAVADLLKHGK